MSCPTCSGTMQKLPVETPPHFWCPRCGTLFVGLTIGPDVARPALVDRCRQYGTHLVVRGRMEGCDLWREIGIAEAINTPEDRPA